MPSAPLILVGTGRCGSTILHKILSHHPHLAWPVRTCNRQPRRLDHNRRIMNLLDWPVVGDLAWRREQAGEVYGFWNHHYRGFGSPFRDLFASDVDERTRRSLTKAFEQLATPSRPTVMMKITGYPRIGFLREIFPDAKFLHIVRDARPTALSDMAMPWCQVWRGPHNWQWGPLTDEQQAIWEASDQSFHVLSVLLWEKIHQSFWPAVEPLDESQYLEIRYEDLCDAPKKSFNRILDFAGLTWHSRFKTKFESYQLRTTNDKWRTQVSEAQAQQMTEAVASTLARYGYDT